MYELHHLAFNCENAKPFSKQNLHINQYVFTLKNTFDHDYATAQSRTRESVSSGTYRSERFICDVCR